MNGVSEIEKHSFDILTIALVVRTRGVFTKKSSGIHNFWKNEKIYILIYESG